MTEQQAAKELGRLVATLGKKPSDLTGEQTASWLRALQDLPYERGRLAIDAVINQWDKSTFPPPGFFIARAKQLTHEGQPNAGAYSQDSGRPWYTTDDAAFLLWRQDRIYELSEEDYWRYVYDREYKRAMDKTWREKWAVGARAS